MTHKKDLIQNVFDKCESCMPSATEVPTPKTDEEKLEYVLGFISRTGYALEEIALVEKLIKQLQYRAESGQCLTETIESLGHFVGVVGLSDKVIVNSCRNDSV